MAKYEVIAFEIEPGRAPFQDWYDGIKDAKAKTIILARIGRAVEGNFGDWKVIAGSKGLCEMRIHYGQGFRIYYSVFETKIVLLLAGSTKQTQEEQSLRQCAILRKRTEEQKHEPTRQTF